MSRLGEWVGDQRALQGDHGGRGVAVQLGELEAQRGVQLGERGAPSVGPRLVAVLGQQLAAVNVERPLIGGRVAIGSRARRGSLEGIDIDLSLENNGAIDEHHCGRAVGARGIERAAGGIERLVQVVRGRVGVAVGPQQLGEPLAVHAAVGRQREDLDQRLGLAQPPRAIGDDVVADGDRETAQQADARLGCVARGSPLPDEPNARTRGRRARWRSPRTAAARGLDCARRPTATRASPVRWRADMRQPAHHISQRILQRDTDPHHLSQACGHPQRFRRRRFPQPESSRERRSRRSPAFACGCRIKPFRRTRSTLAEEHLGAAVLAPTPSRRTACVRRTRWPFSEPHPYKRSSPLAGVLPAARVMPGVRFTPGPGQYCRGPCVAPPHRGATPESFGHWCPNPAELGRIGQSRGSASSPDELVSGSAVRFARSAARSCGCSPEAEVAGSNPAGRVPRERSAEPNAACRP